MMTPQDNISFNLEHMKNKKGEKIDDNKSSEHIVKISLPENTDLEHAILYVS